MVDGMSLQAAGLILALFLTAGTLAGYIWLRRGSRGDDDQLLLVAPGRCAHVELARAMLRHPCWEHRCDCNLYGNPWWPQPLAVLGNDDMRHTEALCQPLAETIP